MQVPLIKEFLHATGTCLHTVSKLISSTIGCWADAKGVLL